MIDEIKRITAELRHAYKQLIESDEPMTKGITKGIIGPQIERLEKLIEPQPVKLEVQRPPRVKRLTRKKTGTSDEE